MKNSVVQDSAKISLSPSFTLKTYNIAHIVWLWDRRLNKYGFVLYGFESHLNLPTDLKQVQAHKPRGRPSSVLLQAISMFLAEPKLGLEDQYFIAISQNTNFLNSFLKHCHLKSSTDFLFFIDTQNFQCNEAMFEAVEQQDLDAVQILLYQYTLEELDLNTPNSEGLTPLDIAILTNNVPIARTLLHVGAKESPHCK